MQKYLRLPKITIVVLVSFLVHSLIVCKYIPFWGSHDEFWSSSEKGFLRLGTGLVLEEVACEPTAPSETAQTQELQWGWQGPHLLTAFYFSFTRWLCLLQMHGLDLAVLRSFQKVDFINTLSTPSPPTASHHYCSQWEDRTHHMHCDVTMSPLSSGTDLFEAKAVT